MHNYLSPPIKYLTIHTFHDNIKLQIKIITRMLDDGIYYFHQNKERLAIIPQNGFLSL
jgi:hypothetical protein